MPSCEDLGAAAIGVLLSCDRRQPIDGVEDLIRQRPPRHAHTRILGACTDGVDVLRVASVRPGFRLATRLDAASAARGRWGSGQASRRPTRQEGSEIRADAKLYLKGRGWRVRGIRVSTVNGHYARAAVQQGRNGPGGEMIVWLRHGIWHEVFLGTDGFCSAKVPK